MARFLGQGPRFRTEWIWVEPYEYIRKDGRRVRVKGYERKRYVKVK